MKENQEFIINLEGIIQAIDGRIVAQVENPFKKMVYTFIKGSAGSNYLKRRGVCSCCQEIEEDWTMFNSWEELEERIGKGWLLEVVARGMCERQRNYH